MPPSRTVSGLDLHLELSATRPGPALAEALRAAVADGRLAAGTRLPASRALAADLAVSRNTVADVYGRLVAEGWLEARVGAGTWVAARAGSRRGREPHPASMPARHVDLRGGLPDTSDFPRAEWVAAVRQAVGHAAVADLGYAPPAGVPALRSALAGYLARTRGVLAGDADVVVTSGFGDLLTAVARALAARGARAVAVEEFGHRRHRDILAAAGLATVALPVDREGAVVERLEGLDVAAVLLTPAHQFPVGVALSAARRRAVVEWAERTGSVVVEDDYDGEFRYDRPQVGALQPLAPDRVVYAGTASKALAPAIGLAWGVVPDWLRTELLDQRVAAGGAMSGLQQLALASFLDSHRYDRHVRRRRAVHRARRDRLVAAVADRLPGARITGIQAGLQCLLELPAGCTEAAVEEQAGRRGVLVQGLARYAVDPETQGHSPALVVGYGAPSAAQLTGALEALLAAVSAAGPPVR